jgi:hypothetical protein
VLARYGNVTGGAGDPGGGDGGSDHPESVDDQGWKEVRGRKSRKHHDELSSDSEKGGRGKVYRQKESDKVKIPPLPAVPGYKIWALAVRDNVIAAAAEIDAALEWISEVHIDTDPNLFADSGRFPSLDMKLGIALTEVARSNM